jgi:hypothetical protein
MSLGIEKVCIHQSRKQHAHIKHAVNPALYARVQERCIKLRDPHAIFREAGFEHVYIGFAQAELKRMMVGELFRIKMSQPRLVKMLKPNVVTLNSQCGSHRFVFEEREPSTLRPVVEPLHLSSQATLEQLAVLAEVVQHSSKPRLFLTSHPLKELARKF